MGTATRSGRTLRASLCEIERGVFYATYPESVDSNSLVTYHVGTSAAEAKKTIEASARALGYDTVIWDRTSIAPLFASQVRVEVRQPASRAASSSSRRV
jgi:uncharacterized protein YcaQ